MDYDFYEFDVFDPDYPMDDEDMDEFSTNKPTKNPEDWDDNAFDGGY